MIDVFIAKAKEKLPQAGKPKILEHPHHMFFSYLESPEGFVFEEQEEGEKALLVLRRHFLTNLHWILISGFLFLVPIIFVPFLSSALSIFDFLMLPNHFILIFTIFYYLVVFTYVFVNFITWYFNVVLITDKKVVDIDFSDLVFKNVAATKHSLLQDAKYSQIGFLRGFFDYGDVVVQTAGTLDNFNFNAVPKPEKVVRLVENLIGAVR